MNKKPKMPDPKDGKVRYYEKVHRRTNTALKKDLPKKYR